MRDATKARYSLEFQIHTGDSMFHFACFLLKIYHIRHRLSEKSLLSHIVTQKSTFKFSRNPISKHFQKNCRRPHEIHYRHPVRRKKRHILCCPEDSTYNLCRSSTVSHECTVILLLCWCCTKKFLPNTARSNLGIKQA